MSEQRKIFYDLLDKSIATEGYQLKKSKGVFEKKNGELLYSIFIGWDGRGGLSFLNGVNANVSIPSLALISRDCLGFEFTVAVPQQPVSNREQYKITQMYSVELLKLVNERKLAEIATMPFEQKYPLGNIEKTVETISRFIKEEVVKFHLAYQNENDVLNWYILTCRHRIDTKLYNFQGTGNFVFTTKLLCKKLNIEEPDFIKKFSLFHNRTLDAQWNLNYEHLNYENLEEKLNAIIF